MQIEALQCENDAILTVVEEQKKEIDELQLSEPAKVKKLQQSIKHLLESEKNNESEIQKLKTEKRNLERQNEEKDNNRRKSAEFRSKQIQNNLEKRYNDLYKEKSKLQTTVDKFTAINREKEKSIDVLKEENSKLAAKDDVIRNLKMKLQENEANLAKVIEDVSAKNTNKEVANKEVANKEVDANSGMSRSGSTGKSKARQDKRIKDLEQQVAILKNEGRSVTSKVKELEAKVATAGESAKSRDTVIHDLQTVNQRFEKQIDELLDECKEIISLYQDLCGVANDQTKTTNRLSVVVGELVSVYNDRFGENIGGEKEKKVKSRTFFQRLFRKRN